MALKDLNFPSTSGSVNTEQLTAALKSNVVQIELKQPFQSPSPLVYELDAQGYSGRLLGQLRGTGKYEFSISESTKGVVVIDGIRKEELFKIVF
ncbi:hypothetical protein ACFSQJ_11920 [Croceitalea marina]|uniref:Uncharacterized protein n=1 Tax=Croceitalea marina TaxID=1775166 RepID=A0ABW5MZ74_9FLAO